jgi:hypothetical protein
MWNQESQEVKDHYQGLAQKSREQHQKEYPGYKYAPRQPGERKRRGVHPEIVFGDSKTVPNTDQESRRSDYGMNRTLNNGDYFPYTSSEPCDWDKLSESVVPSLPGGFDLGQFPTSQHTPNVYGLFQGGSPFSLISNAQTLLSRDNPWRAVQLSKSTTIDHCCVEFPELGYSTGSNGGGHSFVPS